MRSFEIQTFKDGRWKMDSVFDDRRLATREARRANESGRYSGVRLVEENYDEATDLTTIRTLFRGGSAKSDNSKKTGATAKPRGLAPRRGTSREPNRNRGAKPEAKNSNFLVPVLVLLVVILGGLVALLGLQQIASLK